MIRLLLVDNQSLIRQGLNLMFEMESDLKVVGCANNGATALEQVATLQPDVVLMDARIAGDANKATQLITQQFPQTKVVILSTFDEDEQYITDLMRAGAQGYLLKDMPVEELIQVIRCVHKGYSQLAPGLLEKLFTSYADNAIAEKQTQVQLITQLTPRELDVLQLISKGCTNREISQQLHISEGTVKTHITHLFNRLNLRNRAQLAIYAHARFELSKHVTTNETRTSPTPVLARFN